MRIKLTIVLMSIAIMMLGVGCGGDQQAQSGQEATDMAPAVQATTEADAPIRSAAPGAMQGAVIETMDSGGYTYVLVDTGADKVWAATTQFEVTTGDNVSFAPTLPMRGYHSKTLDRTFDLIYFAGHISVGGQGAGSSAPHGMAAGSGTTGHGGTSTHTTASGTEQVDFSGITKAKGGWTIAELYGRKDILAGGEIMVRGKIVKSSANIMGVNWFHIQDGTGAAGTDDLTVTSSGTAQVGQTVLVRGQLTANKDFGSGYFYDLIVEEATLTVE
jgi:hypothetical protein